MAWRNPPGVFGAVDDDPPAGSMVPWAQRKLNDAVRHALAAIAADISAGLAATVGVGATWFDGDPASVVIELSADADTEYIVRAINLENVEAWQDGDGAVHIGIHPWHTIKDTDQTVLAITKVLHVLYGLHAADVESHAHPRAAERQKVSL